MRYFEILNEMLVRHNSSDADTIIAFKDSIWLITWDEFRHNDDGIADEIHNITGLDSSIGDIDGIIDKRPDILVGDYDSRDKTLTIRGINAVAHHPVTSKLVQKVVRQLGIVTIKDGTGYIAYDNNDLDQSYNASEITGSLPQYGYHGTSLKRLRKILKTGIGPQNMGNWGSIHTAGVIFFSVSKDMALFHAGRTANIDNDIPVIIKFKIPDRSRITFDYDVSNDLGDRHIIANNKRVHNLWKDMGIFGYRGRIMPNMFIEFYTTSDAPTADDESDTYFTLSREHMNDYMKAYSWVVDEFGDIQDYISADWVESDSDSIIADYMPEDEDE